MEGHIYCVYDAALPFDDGLIVKCGKTKTPLVKYCRKTYARHMAKPTIACLAYVTNVTYAESTLFLMLQSYRVNEKHEVFSVPTLEVVERAFEGL
eukprot:38821-Eustigmatos_ZCMA.PRE.1